MENLLYLFPCLPWTILLFGNNMMTHFEHSISHALDCPFNRLTESWSWLMLHCSFNRLTESWSWLTLHCPFNRLTESCPDLRFFVPLTGWQRAGPGLRYTVPLTGWQRAGPGLRFLFPDLLHGEVDGPVLQVELLLYQDPATTTTTIL